MFFIHFLFAISFSTLSQTQVIKIWPKLAPGSEKLEDKEQWTEDKCVSNVYQPDLTVCLPVHQNGFCPALVIFPGGGYQKIDIKKEGYKIAKWLNENGIAAFVLKYRLNPNDALRDAQRAMSLIRKDAVKYKIDGNKIGVIGFSAGAHLAGNLVVNCYNHENYDAIDTVSSRPDFWVGVYGGYDDIFSEDVKSEEPVNIPPAFLVHAGDDSKAPVIGSVELYIHLKKRGVPAELHIYEQRKHGFALEENRGAATTSTVLDWSRRFLEWLKVRGIL
jgi:acetyl esterase/lipase